MRMVWFDKRHQEYCQLIRDVFDEYRQVLGAEKIRTILVQRGHQVSTEYISRLMREMGLSSVRSTAKQEYLLSLRQIAKNIPTHIFVGVKAFSSTYQGLKNVPLKI